MGGNLAQRAGKGPRPDGAAPALARARALLAAHGRSSLDHHKLLPDKRLFLAPDLDAFLAFREAAGAAVVLGDPVGPPAAAAALIAAFVARCAAAGRAPVFLQTGAGLLDAYRGAGLDAVRIGAAARIDLARFDLDAPARKPLRNALRRAAAEGLRARRIEPPIPPRDLARLREVNESWLTLPGRLERGFSVGRFDDAEIARCPVSLIEGAGDRVAAFANWIPSPVAGEATVDLIRRRAGAPSCAVDALLAGVLREARALGFRRFDLGLAPLARIDPPFGHPAERVLAALYRLVPASWGHRGLHRWKEKFAPRWTPRWLVYRGGPVAFARAALAVRRVTRAPAAPLPGEIANRAGTAENVGPRSTTEVT